MTGLERYRAMLAGRPVDFVPRTPILMRFAAEHIGASYAQFIGDHRVLVEANTRGAADFDFDQVSCISDPYREAEGFGAMVDIGPNGMPRCTPLLAGSKDLRHLPRPDPRHVPRMCDRIDAVHAFRAHCAGRYSILGWVEGPAAAAANLRGVSAFLTDLLKDPTFVADLMDRCLDAAIAFTRAQVSAGADTVGVGDAVASQVSARLYEELIWPREQQLVTAIQDAGALAKLHICGDITHLLPAIARLGVDVLDVDHMVDLTRVRNEVGPRVALTGNLDPVAAVCQSTPPAIRQALSATYGQAGNPYLVNAGCEIPPGTPAENLRALCAPLERMT
jgi:MtaA/CmuA family methyltransferase